MKNNNMFKELKDKILDIIDEYKYNKSHKDVPKYTEHSVMEKFVEEKEISLSDARKQWLPVFCGNWKKQHESNILRPNDALYGAIFGDMAGMHFEFAKHPDDYMTRELVTEKTIYTDDTVLSIATKYAIENHIPFDEAYHKIGYYFQSVGFGGGFLHWILQEDYHPYNSFGDGSPMRVSYIGSCFDDKDIMFETAYQSAIVTHNHEEGVKGAVVVASCIWILEHGGTKSDVYEYAKMCYPKLDEYKVELFAEKTFSCLDCMSIVPMSIQCFLSSESIEDCMRKVLSLDYSDADTIGAIACSIAASYYGIEKNWKYLPFILDSYKEVCDRVSEKIGWKVKD